MAVRVRAVETLPKLMRRLRKDSPSSTMTQSPVLPSPRRAFSLYDQINLIDNVPDEQLRFQRYTETGFTVNGVNYEGSLLCVENLATYWGPRNFSEISIYFLYSNFISIGFNAFLLLWFLSAMYWLCISFSLSVFQIIRPIPEILILGCGRNIEPVDPELRRFISSTGMKLEPLDSRNAASTYNILNEEGRIVAAALLPYGVSS